MMNSSWIAGCKIGRHSIGRLARQVDIVNTAENLRRDNGIAMAGFTIRGSVTQATFGVFDRGLAIIGR